MNVEPLAVASGCQVQDWTSAGLTLRSNIIRSTLASARYRERFCKTGPTPELQSAFTRLKLQHPLATARDSVITHSRFFFGALITLELTDLESVTPAYLPNTNSCERIAYQFVSRSFAHNETELDAKIPSLIRFHYHALLCLRLCRML